MNEAVTRIAVAYSQLDKAFLMPIVARLSTEHFDVWWSEMVSIGENFRDKIDNEFSKADVVFVCWSARSRNSNEVKNEANWAQKHGKYFGVVIEKGVEPPIEFTNVLYADLSEFPKCEETFREVLAALRERSGMTSSRPSSELDRSAEAHREVGPRSLPEFTSMTAKEVLTETSQDKIQDRVLRGGKLKPLQILRDRLDIPFWGPELIYLPPGRFVMGSRDEENAFPPVAMTIDKGFFLSTEVVTKGLYRLFESALDPTVKGIDSPFDYSKKGATSLYSQLLGQVRLDGGSGADTYPYLVSDPTVAETFCKWLSVRTGERYRLPQEIEWEYACRAGSLGNFSWLAMFKKRNRLLFEQARLQPAGGLNAVRNPWGFSWMVGNVWEVCKHPRQVRSVSTTCRYVLRGGSSKERSETLQLSLRKIPLHQTGFDQVGFRVVREVS